MTCFLSAQRYCRSAAGARGSKATDAPAYDFVMQFSKRLDAKAITPELGLAIESDRALYLSQLGWLGHVECRALERDIAKRFGAIWQSPFSPALERLKKSIAFNFSKCRDQNSGR